MAGRPGQKSGGHNRKSIEQHLADGTYRENVHGALADHVQPSGKPIKPRGLKGRAATAWKHLVDSTPEGVYGEQDTELLALYCQLWEDVHEQRVNGTFASYMKAVEKFISIAARVGAGPIDRSRLKMKSKPAKEESLDDFMLKVS